MDDSSHNIYLTSTHESDDSHLQKLLKGNVKYDDPSVLSRLRLDELDTSFVQECMRSIKEHLASDIAEYTRLSDKASLEDNEELEEFEKHAGWDVEEAYRVRRAGNYGSEEEIFMYDPLSNIFSHITDFTQDGHLVEYPRCRFHQTQALLKPDEPQTFGFPSVFPDFTVTSTGSATKSGSEAKPTLHSRRTWANREAFAEVKPSIHQGPLPTTDKDGYPVPVPPILARSASYARLNFSARPFTLFCTGLLVFGTRFCVGIFDRAGVTLSPIHDLFVDLDVFVGVVYSIAHRLSVFDLGLDPTVKNLTLEETSSLSGQEVSSIAYPSVIVPAGISYGPFCESLKMKREWCTIGHPIWTSHTLLGRGTHVWRVREYIAGDPDTAPRLRGKTRILKSSWRNSARTNESQIYEHIHSTIPSIRVKGLAKFKCGGDVLFPGSEIPITAQNLRNYSAYTEFLSQADPTPVLHRLVLSTVGRPMWEYRDDLELLRGFRDALLAHKSLSDHGILHRDISAGNVLLKDPEDDGSYAFITDVEYARVETFGTSANSPIVTSQNVHMTGTAQFMARELLVRYGPDIRHEVHHDIESFIWVLLYSILRHIISQSSAKSVPPSLRPQRDEIMWYYKTSFTQVLPKTIAQGRHSDSPVFSFLMGQDDDVRDLVDAYVSEALQLLVINDFRNLIWESTVHGPLSMHRGKEVPLTYGAVLGATNAAIEKLEKTEENS